MKNCEMKTTVSKRQLDMQKVAKDLPNGKDQTVT